MESLLGWLIHIVLFLSVFAFAGVHPPAIFATRLLIALAALCHIVLLWRDRDYFSAFPPGLLIPFSFFLLFLGLAGLQYAYGLRLLEGSRLGTLGRHETLDSLVQLLFYLLFFISCLKITGRRSWIEIFISSVLVLVLLTTLLGVAQKLSGAERLFWYSMKKRGMFFGPFINENNYGGFLTLTVPFLVYGMHRRFANAFAADQRRHSTARRSWHYLSFLIDSGAFLAFFLIALTLVAALFSGARSSAPIIFASLSVYMMAYSIAKKNVKPLVTLILMVAGAAFILRYLDVSAIRHAFSPDALRQGLSIRMRVMGNSVQIFQLFPAFGIGLGSFLLISARYVNYPDNSLWWEHVHNDYAELLVETGWVGFSLFLLAMTGLFVISVIHFKKSALFSRWRIVQAWIALGGIAVVEFFGFHLKIPCIAFLFTLQMAMMSGPGDGVRSAVSLPRGRVSRGHSAGLISFSNKVLLSLLGIILVVFLCVYSTRQFYAYFLSRSETPGVENLKKAVRLAPENAQLWHLLGKTYYERYKENAAGRDASELKRLSLAAFRKALDLNPTFAYRWFALGKAEYAMGDAEQGIESLEKACRWAPFMIQYQLRLMVIYLREVQKAGDVTLKAEYLKRARAIYFGLLDKNQFPGYRLQLRWLGKAHYKLFHKIKPAWDREYDELNKSIV